MRLFLSAFIAFLIVFPITMIRHAIKSNPKRREPERAELKKIAIERGHVVTAKLIRIQTFYNEPVMSHRSFESAGVYEYFYNGKRYIYKFGADNPPWTLELYFVDKPRKATVDLALKRDPKVPWPVNYLVVLAIVYFIVGA